MRLDNSLQAGYVTGLLLNRQLVTETCAHEMHSSLASDEQ